MIRLVEASEENRNLLWNIHQKYLHEMTNYYENEMDADGNYHYGYFDAYFIEPERRAFLLYDDSALIGFAMVNPYSYFHREVDYVMAEFTVFPMFRKKHLGTAAARKILETFRGRWEIKYNEKNTGAKKLWTKVTAGYHPAQHAYSDTETVLEFSNPV